MEKEKKKELFRTIKFVLCSVSAGLIQIGSFSVMTLFFGETMPYMFRYLIALVLSVLWNFTLNRRFTFQSAGNVPVAMMKVALFYAVFTPVTMFGGEYLVKCGWNDFVVEVLTMALNFVTEYIYDRFFVFGSTIDTNKAAKKAEEREDL